MRRLLDALALGILVLVPALPVFGILKGRVVGPNPDALVLLALLAAAVAVRRPATVSRWGTWRAAAVSVAWAALVSFEGARAVVIGATNDDLPLYDAVLLGKHLYVLGRDLYGWGALLALMGVAVTPLGILAVGLLATARLERWWASLAPSTVAGACAALALAVAACGVTLPPGRWVTRRMVWNAQDSWALYQEVHRELVRSHEDLRAVRLSSRPDVLVYVVESYGNVLATAPDFAPTWTAVLGALDERLLAEGWSTGAGLSEAPVHGGRSWIADASVMFGLRLGHQTSYEHAITFVDSLSHLPGFFERNGYTTVLVKPTDRERPGVRLENPFRYQRTLFFDDLGYRGPVVGWGVIPDQYAIGFAHDTVLDELPGPTYAFFHLATSHMPWPDAPALLPDWRAWQDLEGSRTRVFPERSVESEIALRIARFKRDDPKAPEPRTAVQAQRDRYLDNAVYSLLAVGEQLARGAERPTLVLVMGDHQPPLVAAGTGFEVPVHVLATDPALLRGFLDAGFVQGMTPPATRTLGHEDLFPLLVRSLAGADRGTP